MNKYRMALKAVSVLLVVVVLVASSGCAWMFNGFRGKDEHERSPNIAWGYFILDLLFTGAIGLIIDFASGAIYSDKSRALLYFVEYGSWPGEHDGIPFAHVER